jgi:hypothetical protein
MIDLVNPLITYYILEGTQGRMEGIHVKPCNLTLLNNFELEIKSARLTFAHKAGKTCLDVNGHLTLERESPNVIVESGIQGCTFSFHIDSSKLVDGYGYYLQLEQDIIVHPATDLYKFLFSHHIYQYEDRYSYEELLIQDLKMDFDESDGRIQLRWADKNSSSSPFLLEKSKGVALRLHRVPVQDLSEMLKVLNLLRNQTILNNMFTDYVRNAMIKMADRIDYCVLRIDALQSIILEVSIKGIVSEISVKIEHTISMSVKIDDMDSQMLKHMSEKLTQSYSLTNLIGEYIDFCHDKVKHRKLDSLHKYSEK